MSIKNRNDFINKSGSEKITLAHVNAKTRLYTFDAPMGSVYSKVVPYFISGVKQNDQELTPGSDSNTLVPGQFFYDIETSTLYVKLSGDVSPKSVELIATCRFFFADKGLALPHNLQDISTDVFYDGRIVTSPGYKHKIGIDQALTSLIGEGTLHLKNQDGGLDEIFDKLIFENQDVTIYSWNPYLKPSEARVIYRGQITNKTFDGIDVKFKIKDLIFNLLDSPSMEQYTESDNVADSVQGQFKRRVYGRVDGLRSQSIDQISSGYTLTGTVRALAAGLDLYGTGTLFLTEVRQGDNITIGTQEFVVDNVKTNTHLILSDEVAYSFAGQVAIVSPERGTRFKNRTYLSAGHICAEVTHQVVDALQFNRMRLSDTTGLFPGDFIEFIETGERIEIRNTAPGNIVVLQQNVLQKPSVGTDVVRRPIQEIYIGNSRVQASDFTINNTINGCGFTLSNDAEFNLARAKNSPLVGTFTNGSRWVYFGASDIPLDDVFTPGDWVKPNALTYNTFFEVVNVNTELNRLELVSGFTDASTTDTVEYKSPDYITDETSLSVNILGKTEDGTASGQWIYSASQTQLDLIKDIGINAININSFNEGLTESPQLISMAIPKDYSVKTPPTVKSLVDEINKSVHCSLTLDNDLLIKFKTLNVVTGENIPTIDDSDVIEWKIKSTNGKTFKRIFSRYRFVDIDLSTMENGNRALSFESQFVERYIGTNKVDELDLFLYKRRDAEIATHRHSYYNRLGVATLTVTTDLRLEDIEIGEVVIADFKKMYRRFGSNTHRKKVMLVIGKELTGSRTILTLSDLGNTFNTSSYITPNDAPIFTSATDDQKLIYGYITDNQGITNDEEDTAGIHLIS